MAIEKVSKVSFYTRNDMSLRMRFPTLLRYPIAGVMGTSIRGRRTSGEQKEHNASLCIVLYSLVVA